MFLKENEMFVIIYNKFTTNYVVNILFKKNYFESLPLYVCAHCLKVYLEGNLRVKIQPLLQLSGVPCTEHMSGYLNFEEWSPHG